MAQRRVTIILEEELGQPDKFTFETPLKMEDAHLLLVRAEKYLFLTLIRNTIKRDLEQGPRVIAAGEGTVGIDLRRLRG